MRIEHRPRRMLKWLPITIEYLGGFALNKRPAPLTEYLSKGQDLKPIRVSQCMWQLVVKQAVKRSVGENRGVNYPDTGGN